MAGSLAGLHRTGEYRHGTTARFPGKVLCCHRDEALRPGWTTTPAQQQADQAHQGPPPASPRSPAHGDAVAAQAAPLMGAASEAVEMGK